MSAEYMQNSYITSVYLNGTASGTSELLSTKVDLKNSTLGAFSNLTFVLSTLATDTAVTFVIKESSDDSTYTAISGATITTTAAGGVYMIDVSLGGPRLRYYKVSITPSTSVAARTLSCIAIGSNPAFGVNGDTEATRATNAGLVSRVVV
jgi:hypothetical protein